MTLREFFATHRVSAPERQRLVIYLAARRMAGLFSAVEG